MRVSDGIVHTLSEVKDVNRVFRVRQKAFTCIGGIMMKISVMYAMSFFVHHVIEASHSIGITLSS